MYLGEEYSHSTRKRTSNYVSCLLWCACALLPIKALSQVSVQLPATNNSGARDRIVTPERFECENSLSGKAQVEYGVAASNAQTSTSFSSSVTPDAGKNITVYGKLVIPIGAPKSRIDCNRLFELEVRKRELEIKLLEMQTQPDYFKPAEVPNSQGRNPSSGTSSSAR
jgi:hypothetical protein